MDQNYAIESIHPNNIGIHDSLSIFACGSKLNANESVQRNYHLVQNTRYINK